MNKITITASEGDAPALLTPAEVAQVFKVDAKTVARWTANGWIPQTAYIRTLGGHRRYRRAAIEDMLNGQNGGQR